MKTSEELRVMLLMCDKLDNERVALEARDREVRAAVLREFAEKIDIPDAPVSTEHVCSVPCRMLAQATPVPSRAELIELMRDVYLRTPELTLRGVFAEVLDALTKAGVMRT